MPQETQDLRKTLDMLGIEHQDVGDLTFWHDRAGIKWCSQEQPEGTLHLQAITFLSAQQALEATLGGHRQ